MEREDLSPGRPGRPVRTDAPDAPDAPRDTTSNLDTERVIHSPPRPPREEEHSHGEPADVVDERATPDPFAIRAEDTEPYFGLQYIARLFKVAAMVVVVALTAEIVAGVALEGASAILPLLAEVIRGVVLAAILWGAGDLTLLLIDVGHDVRAARVLLGRLTARATPDTFERSERER